MAHRKITQHALRSRMKRLQAKTFNAYMPEALHGLIKTFAADRARELGGQPNMNRVILEALLNEFGEALEEDELQSCREFVERL